ncbi:hypothetical protein DY000_02015907 [Brassica cretica]|uniref:Uncharacterized protein n=1 Tax=Brassica cretica TaxID=69181 RepID=A0ABQ7CWY7_BRACR|nr:hypothetical protein DY000_02015907 [Brassica cretica]
MPVFGFFTTQAKTSSGTVSSVVWSWFEPKLHSGRMRVDPVHGSDWYGRLDEPRLNCSEHPHLHAELVPCTDPWTGAHQKRSRTVKQPSPNSPNRRVGPNEQSISPIRRVGSTSLPSSRHRSSLLQDRIEPALVSARSESPLELYDLKIARIRFLA